MAFVPNDWQDLPAELAPTTGETLAQWYARIAVYDAANPGALTPVTAAALEDMETRLAAYADSVATGGGEGVAVTDLNDSAPSTASASAWVKMT